MSIGVSLALITVGAILTFALEREAEGINLDTVGIILMIVGALGLIISALFWSSWSPYGRGRRSATVGRSRTVVSEREDPLA